MFKFMDAAIPPQSAPPGISGVMGYIGGPHATRVWTLEEWLRFQHLPQVPIYVPDVNADPNTQGEEAASLARARGWAPWMNGNSERIIIIDMEALVAAAFYEQLAATITIRGFVPVCYGSMSTVLGNAARDVLGALWDVIPRIPAGQTLHGLQYEANVPFGGTVVDYSVVDAWFFNRAGVGPRKAAG